MNSRRAGFRACPLCFILHPMNDCDRFKTTEEEAAAVIADALGPLQPDGLFKLFLHLLLKMHIAHERSGRERFELYPEEIFLYNELDTLMRATFRQSAEYERIKAKGKDPMEFYEEYRVAVGTGKYDLTPAEQAESDKLSRLADLVTRCDEEDTKDEG